MEGEIGAGVLDRNPSAQVSLCRNCGGSSSAGLSPCCGSPGGRANNAGPSTSFVFVKPTNSFQEHRYFIICYCYISIDHPPLTVSRAQKGRGTEIDSLPRCLRNTRRPPPLRVINSSNTGMTPTQVNTASLKIREGAWQRLTCLLFCDASRGA